MEVKHESSDGEARNEQAVGKRSAARRFDLSTLVEPSAWRLLARLHCTTSLLRIALMQRSVRSSLDLARLGGRRSRSGRSRRPSRAR